MFFCHYISLRGEIWVHNTATVNGSACGKPGMLAVMYLCVRGIDFVFLSDFLNYILGMFRQCVIFEFFILFHFTFYLLSYRTTLLTYFACFGFDRI